MKQPSADTRPNHAALIDRLEEQSGGVYVRWIDGNGAWCVLGGGMPRSYCWSQHGTEDEATAEAAALRLDLGL